MKCKCGKDWDLKVVNKDTTSHTATDFQYGFTTTNHALKGIIAIKSCPDCR